MRHAGRPSQHGSSWPSARRAGSVRCTCSPTAWAAPRRCTWSSCCGSPYLPPPPPPPAPPPLPPRLPPARHRRVACGWRRSRWRARTAPWRTCGRCSSDGCRAGTSYSRSTWTRRAAATAPRATDSSASSRRTRSRGGRGARRCCTPATRSHARRGWAKGGSSPPGCPTPPCPRCSSGAARRTPSSLVGTSATAPT